MERFAILDHAPIGQFVLDQHFTVLFWNQCLEIWSEIPRERIVGDSIFSRFPHLQEPKYADRIKTIFHGGPPIVFSSQLHRHIIPIALPDGTFRIQYTVVTSVPAPTGSEFFAIFSIQDVTSLTSALDTSRNALKQLEREIEEHKKTERNLIEATKNLEKANQAKSEFLANLSHELRSPLNSLLVLSQILAENENGNLNEEEVEYAATIHSSGTDLLTLINDLLDLAKVEAAKMEISVDTLDLHWLRDDIKRKYGPMAEQKGLSFTVELAPDVPRYIMTDSQRLAQMLRNLISNSFKFTPAGTVKVTVSRPETTAPGATLIFAVADTGIGIPEDKLQLIFEAFTQADGSTTRKYGGTGLGLSISREFAKLLGGEIRVRSRVGEGSVFTIHLPCTLAQAEETLPSQDLAVDGNAMIITGPGREAGAVERRRLESDRRVRNRPAPDHAKAIGRRMADLSRHLRPQADGIMPLSPASGSDMEQGKKQMLRDKTILIVEDDMRNVFTFMNILKKRGAKVLVGKNGREGLERFIANPGVDLVLMDIMMPLLDGYSAMQQIRRMESENRRVPILALTAKAMPGDREKCLEAGADDYLAKPVEADILLARIQKILSA